MDQKRSAQKVLEFYDLTWKLKHVIRSGWKCWNVRKDRLESIAEHVYGTCMLAIAIDSEFEYHLDISKIVLMLAIHELEETIMGDITPFSPMSEEMKKEKGRMVVVSILSPMIKGEEYIKLIDEFNERKTPESKFAYFCDKLEADIMSMKYDCDKEFKYEYAYLSLIQDPKMVDLEKKGAKTMGDFFYQYDIENVGYDENFRTILDFAKNEFY